MRYLGNRPAKRRHRVSPFPLAGIPVRVEGLRRSCSRDDSGFGGGENAAFPPEVRVRGRSFGLYKKPA